ncbi:hypothetical protein Xoosp2_70 [Xanthomonas phage Xoo-sp2]|uniref:Uncharacterized protein n=1 Tax=Xanthomonas phage Xoo-sp2 TaxID=1852622 RepID=A0A1X9IAS5_9CAUD|nr:hypothetical protein JTY55_gp70 [Xanthomonas phage Xoo-sp2]ANT45292.1 hypothetical protein Xoosp2_70 [Xanthomonas phage Xoo-sp2]
MRYKIHWKRDAGGPYKSASTVITRDERVVWTTPALRWAVGWRIGHLLDALFRKMSRWELVGEEYEPRPEVIE